MLIIKIIPLFVLLSFMGPAAWAKDPCLDLMLDPSPVALVKDSFRNSGKFVQDPKDSIANPDADSSLPSGQCLDLISELIGKGKDFAGGSGVDFGTGMVESYFADALFNLVRILNKTIQENKQLSTEHRSLLQNIMDDLPEEYAVRPLIRFSKGDAFLISGSPRIAYTKLEVGTPIFVNSDMLYQTSNGITAPAISYSVVIQILIHELGHHQGEEDHELLNELGAAVANHWLEDRKDLSLRNGGFEEFYAQTYWPQHWYIGSLDPSFVSMASPPARGQLGMRLLGYNAASYGTLFQCTQIPDHAKEKFLNVSALIKPQLSLYAGGNLYVQVFDTNNQLESFANGNVYWTPGYPRTFMTTGLPQMSYIFSLVNYSFYLSRQAQQLCVGFYLFGYGNIVVDDVQIEIL